MKWISILLVLLAAPLWAADLSEDTFTRMAASQVIILGEVHDNPGHHLNQSELISRLAPAGIIYEMLTSDQAARVTPDLLLKPKELSEALKWDETGWPSINIYAPVFSAFPKAKVFGARVPRSEARRVLSEGLMNVFGPDAKQFGLAEPLPEAEQIAREALQLAAHCNALPDDMLGGMVAIQRLRDAQLARVTLSALDAVGPPVVIITGNGHARRDWGIPRYLKRVRPELAVFVLGQSENAVSPDGPFDAILSAKAPTRDDPCKAFQNKD